MSDQDRIPQGSDIGQVTTAAVMLHEVFTSFMDAGFTEQQALSLVAQITIANKPSAQE